MYGVKDGQKSSDQLRVLGLTRAEEKVLDALLKGGTMSVTALSRFSRVPRTTIHAVLDRLHSRGLVRHVDSTYRSLWRVVGRSKLQNRLASGITYFDEHLSAQEISEKIGVNVSEKTQFLTFQGLDSLLKVYLWFFLNHHGQRLRGIQSNLSSETIVKKLGAEKTAQINDVVKTSRIIVEAILPESVVNLYRNIATKDLGLLKTVEGRTTAVHLVPDALLQFNADLLLGRDTAIFANWDEEVLVLIRNPEFTKMISNLYDLMAQMGKSFDQNAFVRGLVEESRKSV